MNKYTYFEGQFSNKESIEIEKTLNREEFNIGDIAENLQREARRKWGSSYRAKLEIIYMKDPNTDEDLDSWDIKEIEELLEEK